MPTLRPLVNPAEEFERLKALGALRLDNEHLDRSLQEIVERVAEVYRTRVCMVNLILEDKQLFMAWAGKMPDEVTATRELPRENAICSYVVASHMPLVVEDLQASDEWRDQYLSKFGVRFYAGVPLIAHNKHALGTLCLLDTKPNTISAEGLETLQMFAARTAAELELSGEQAYTRRLRAELEKTAAYAQSVAEFMLALQTITEADRIADLAVRTLSRAARLEACVYATMEAGSVKTIASHGSLPDESRELDSEMVNRWSSNPTTAPVGMAVAPLDGVQPRSVLIASRRGEEWRSHDQFLLDTIGRSTASAMTRSCRMKDLENAAVTDELTGLPNRRALEELSSNPRQLRDNYRVLLGDLAGFKKVNDQLGHAVGDVLLRDVARALTRELRPSDASRVFRYGGDEFVIVLATKEGGGDKVAARLERAMEQVAAEYPGIGVRLDLGEAVVPFDASTLDEALRIADVRMYERKRSRGGARA